MNFIPIGLQELDGPASESYSHDQEPSNPLPAFLDHDGKGRRNHLSLVAVHSVEAEYMANRRKQPFLKECEALLNQPVLQAPGGRLITDHDWIPGKGLHLAIYFIQYPRQRLEGPYGETFPVSFGFLQFFFQFPDLSR